MAYLILILTIPILLATLRRIDLHQNTAKFFAQTTERTVHNFQPISIFVPVRGVDQEAEQNYLSYIQQNYPAPFAMIFALEKESDPAVKVIEKLITHHPERAVTYIISDGSPGSGKIKNQIAAAQKLANIISGS